ncbi:MAG: transketolase family protein [Candidatus Eremiobacteraeota bacterium]|nr:transketolase family protein [Candidatus Eremiobacteraeota bacterium]
MHLVEDIYNDDIIMSPARNGYGEGLVEIGRENPNVVVLCGDLTDSTRTSYFKKEFPDRFYEMGIAEQNMVAVACGLSLVGKIPYAATYGAFIPGRSFDQIRVSAGYNNSNVKLSGTHVGISVGPDGATHQMMEDIAMMRALPGFTVIAPCDHEETRKATIAAGKITGPVYLRFGRDKIPVITTKDTPFEIGKANILRDGSDVAIVANGSLVYEALIAANELEKQRVHCMVINMHTVKPLDHKTLTYCARKCGAVVSAEEHQVNGGLGGAIAESLARNHPVPQEFIGMPDKYGESGKPRELMKKYGMSSEAIISAVKRLLTRKEKRRRIIEVM